MQSAGPRAVECPADRREPARTSCRTPRRGGGGELGALGVGGWGLEIGEKPNYCRSLPPVRTCPPPLLRVLPERGVPAPPCQPGGAERCSITIRHSPPTRRNTAVQAP